MAVRLTRCAPANTLPWLQVQDVSSCNLYAMNDRYYEYLEFVSYLAAKQVEGSFHRQVFTMGELGAMLYRWRWGCSECANMQLSCTGTLCACEEWGHRRGHARAPESLATAATLCPPPPGDCGPWGTDEAHWHPGAEHSQLLLWCLLSPNLNSSSMQPGGCFGSCNMMQQRRARRMTSHGTLSGSSSCKLSPSRW